MRWGVVDDNTLDHSTYGYTPLPREIDEKHFTERVQNCENEKLVELANSWYLLDMNAVPPVYTLRSLSSVNDP
eukprot:gene23845-30120_t